MFRETITESEFFLHGFSYQSKNTDYKMFTILLPFHSKTLLKWPVLFLRKASLDGHCNSQLLLVKLHHLERDSYLLVLSVKTLKRPAGDEVEWSLRHTRQSGDAQSNERFVCPTSLAPQPNGEAVSNGKLEKLGRPKFGRELPAANYQQKIPKSVVTTSNVASNQAAFYQGYIFK